MTEEEELKAKIRQLQDRVQDHKAAARDSRAYKPYPQPQPRSPVSFRNRSLVVSSPGNGNQTQGVVKRGGATVQWLSRQQNMAKLEGLKRHEEQLHETEKERILQHAQIPNVPISSWPDARNSESVASTPKVINVQGSTFHVTSGGNKLLRISDKPGMAMATPKEITVHGVPFKRSKHGNLIRTKAITQGNRNCPLPHVDRASQMRKRLANKTGDAMDVDNLSSEEELYDGIDSEDVDSSDLDEPPEQVFGADNAEITERDFIGFTS